MTTPPDQPGRAARGRTTIRMPRSELVVLLVVAAVAAATFLPLTHDLAPAGVSMIAWQLWFLMIAAPAAGLVAALRSGKE